MKKKLIILTLLAVAPLKMVAASTDSRLKNLERLTEAQGQVILELRQQLSSAFRDIDDLRGQLEYTTHQLNQMIARQKNILIQLEGGDNNIRTINSTENNSATTNNRYEYNGMESEVSNYRFTGNDKQDYDAILDILLKQNRNKEALLAFKAFINYYSRSNYLSNVTYWIGQIYYNQGNYDEASRYFAAVVKNYPNHSKAAECMYKVGLIMEDKGEATKAKAIYRQVINKYPNASITTEVNRHLTMMP